MAAAAGLIHLPQLIYPPNPSHPGRMSEESAFPSAALKSSPPFHSQGPSGLRADSFKSSAGHRISTLPVLDRKPRGGMIASAASALVDGRTVEGSQEGSAAGKVVVIDNYDSFTYNLCQYLGDLGCDFVVYRNDELTVDELRDMRPRGILISPGPGTPEDSGISMQTVRELGPTVPLFGVCMGLQCMGQVYGGRIVRAPGGVMHGKTSDVFHSQTGADGGLLVGLPNPFTAARYHSLVIDRETFPGSELEVTAWTADGLVMGVRHLTHRHVEGVQFHPESIITENGKRIVANFLHGLEMREKANQ